MTIAKITLPILSINTLIDNSKNVSVDEVFKHLKDHSIFDFLLTEFKDVDLEGIRFLNNFPEDKKELLEALSRLANTVVPEDLGIENRQHGLLFLNAMFNQLIQSNVKEITFK